jgi:hypothetical protein
MFDFFGREGGREEGREGGMGGGRGVCVVTRMFFRIFLLFFLLFAAPSRGQLIFLKGEIEYARFIAHHDVYRLVLYDPAHLGSLRLLEKLRAEGGHLATAALVASSVSEFSAGEIPRIVVVDRRPQGLRRLLEEEDAAVQPIEYGTHHARLSTRADAHYLLLLGNQLPGAALEAFGTFAETAGVPCLYARAGPKTENLFATFGFKPYMKHQMHFILRGKSVEDARTFEFGTREEFEVEIGKVRA